MEWERLREPKTLAQDHTEKSIAETKYPNYCVPAQDFDFSYLPTLFHSVLLLTARRLYCHTGL